MNLYAKPATAIHTEARTWILDRHHQYRTVRLGRVHLSSYLLSKFRCSCWPWRATLSRVSLTITRSTFGRTTGCSTLPTIVVGVWFSVIVVGRIGWWGWAGLTGSSSSSSSSSSSWSGTREWVPNSVGGGFQSGFCLCSKVGHYYFFFPPGSRNGVYLDWGQMDEEYLISCSHCG